MTFKEKLIQLSAEAYRKASEENDLDAHTDLINQHGKIVHFMAINGYSPMDDFIEPN